MVVKKLFCQKSTNFYFAPDHISENTDDISSNLLKYLFVCTAVQSTKYNITFYWYLLCLDIDFFINGLCKENRLWSQRTATPYKIKVKKFKLIDFVMRIELAPAILMPRFLNFLINLIIHFCMFLYFVSWILRVTVRCYAGYKLYQRYMFKFIPV